MPRKVKTIEQTQQQTLEMMVAECDYRTRDAALVELNGRIQLILHPRATFSHGGAAHFLPIPQPPRVRISRAGLPEPGDDKQQKASQEELQAVSQRERQLNDLAQKARSMASTLYEWAVEMGKTEDRLLISPPLTEADRPAVEDYVAEHQRFLRTCQAWCEKLRF